MSQTSPVSDKAEATRQRIVDTAETLFRSMGYQKTAVADIARELGMSPANVYRFFPSKSAINEAICARLLGGIEEDVWRIARDAAPAAARLRRIGHQLLDSNLSVLFGQKRMLDMVMAAMAEHWDVCQRYVDAVHGALRHVIADGMRDGDFAKGEADRLAGAFKHGLVVWFHPTMLQECREEADEAMLRQQLDDMMGLMIRGLRA